MGQEISERYHYERNRVVLATWASGPQ
jgi:hypothetical protein